MPMGYASGPGGTVWAQGGGPGPVIHRKVNEGDQEDSEQSPAVVRIIQEISPLEGPRDNSEKRRLALLLTRGTIE